jgi:hypothetical protein
MVLFNRSWYNRAGVEPVMGFCTDSEYESFLQDVIPFEHMLIASGIQILKYYLDIGKKEQKKRPPITLGPRKGASPTRNLPLTLAPLGLLLVRRGDLLRIVR